MPAPDSALILSATIPVAALMGLGHLLRRACAPDEAFRSGLTFVVMRVFFPALILAKVSVNPSLKDDSVMLWALGAGFASSAVGFLIAGLFAKACGAHTTERARAFVYSTGHYNFGYLAIPICDAIYGHGAIAVLLLFNTGLEFSFWTIGTMILKGEGLRGAFKNIVTPITAAMFAAILANRTDIAGHAPEWVFKTLEMLGGCAVPCGLVLVGMTMSALLQGFRAAHDPRISVGSTLLRNGLIPATFLLAAITLPMPKEISRILLLQAAMPAGAFPLVMCRQAGVAPHIALRVFVATTLAGIVTIPAWLWIGSHFAP